MKGHGVKPKTEGVRFPLKKRFFGYTTLAKFQDYFIIAPQRAKRAGGHTKPLQACESHIMSHKMLEQATQVPQIDGNLGSNISHKTVSYDKKSYTTTNSMY